MSVFSEQRIVIPFPRFVSADDIRNKGGIYTNPEGEELLQRLSLPANQKSFGCRLLFNPDWSEQYESVENLLGNTVQDAYKELNPWAGPGMALYWSLNIQHFLRYGRILIWNRWQQERYFWVTPEGDAEGRGEPHISLCAVNKQYSVKRNTAILVAA